MDLRGKKIEEGYTNLVTVEGESVASSGKLQNGQGTDLGNVAVGGLSFNTGDGELQLPAGTTAERPASPSAGYARFNTDIGKVEIFTGNAWLAIALEGAVQLEAATAAVTGQDAVAVGETYTNATGGTTLEYDSGGKRYRSHTFTSDGTFTVTEVGDSDGDRDKVDYLIIAGGGSGTIDRSSGGGGAGGYRTTNGTSGGNSTAESKISVTETTYSVVVGAGGAETTSSADGNNGSDSSALGITSTGGGYGGLGFGQGTNNGNGESGGSGGGAGGGLSSSKSGGSATSSQGFAGGDTSPIVGTKSGGAGGGGAGEIGNSNHGAEGRIGGDGGDGLSNILRTGSAETRAGGGGGSARSSGDVSSSGGTGGGGNGGGISPSTAGAVNTGGGGGAQNESGGSSSGGSGIVIIRYEIEPT